MDRGTDRLTDRSGNKKIEKNLSLVKQNGKVQNRSLAHRWSDGTADMDAQTSTLYKNQLLVLDWFLSVWRKNNFEKW